MHLSESHEEQLFVGEINGWKSWLSTVFRCPVLVGVERRLQSTTVRYVLTQCLPTSKLYSHRFKENVFSYALDAVTPVGVPRCLLSYII